MKKIIEFHPKSQSRGQAISRVVIELLEKTNIETAVMDCSAVILEVSGEHSDPAWIGETFQYSIELDSNFDIKADDSPREWTMCRAFGSSVLKSDKFQFYAPSRNATAD